MADHTYTIQCVYEGGFRDGNVWPSSVGYMQIITVDGPTFERIKASSSEKDWEVLEVNIPAPTKAVSKE